MLLTAVISYITASEIILWGISRTPSSLPSPQYLILLGHKGGEQSPVTRDRVVNAIEALKKWPHAKLIVTGNENKGEVSHFRTMLAAQGVSDFQVEEKSFTTWDNFKNILNLLPSKNDSVVIVTSEYHQRRSLLIAKSYGINARAFGKDRQKYENRLRLFFKERFALWYSVPKAIWIRLTN